MGGGGLRGQRAARRLATPSILRTTILRTALFTPSNLLRTQKRARRFYIRRNHHLLLFGKLHGLALLRHPTGLRLGRLAARELARHGRLAVLEQLLEVVEHLAVAAC